MQSKFGKALAENIRIAAYEGPHGKGYQIYYEENGTAHSIGYAPEVADRTYTAEAEREEKGPFEKGNLLRQWVRVGGSAYVRGAAW